MRKITILAVCLFGSASLLMASGAFAETSSTMVDTVAVQDVPMKAKPNAVLEYKNGEFAVIQEEVPGNQEEHAMFSETSTPDWPEEILQKMKHSDIVTDEELNNLPHHSEVQMLWPKAEEGMIIHYNFEGDIQSIYLNGSKVLASNWAKGPAEKGTYGPWGNHKNKIVATDKQVEGTGRITNFFDKIGNHDNELKKFDVATKGIYDNPKSDTVINVRNFNNDLTVSCYKNDIGSLPDAVLDVFRTTLEEFGEKEDKNTSFPGRYHYWK